MAGYRPSTNGERSIDMAVQTAAGCKIFIGPANTTADSQSDYESLSYTLIGEVENIGEFGDTFNEITFTPISDRRVRKFKGSKNAGTLPLVLGRDVTDAGQAAMKAARDSDSEYAFMVQQNDVVSGSPSNPTTFWFRALVMGFTIDIGDAESIIRANGSLGINSDVVEIAAVTD
jgi:hypothetical protein